MKNIRTLLTALINSGKLSVDDLIDMDAYFGYGSHEPTKGICDIIDDCISSLPEEEVYPYSQLKDGLLYHEGTKHKLGYKLGE